MKNNRKAAHPVITLSVVVLFVLGVWKLFDLLAVLLDIVLGKY